MPERIGRLDELAHNLWWSWQPKARDLFRALDYPLWRASGHNPVKLLRDINADKLQAAAGDPAFIARYDAVLAAFDADMSGVKTWFYTRYLGQMSEPIAYFSAEYAIHNSLPIYAGGLGILSGDICKEVSDLGMPMVAVGFMYPQGYFHQHISPDGWQEEIYQQLNFDEAPVNPVFASGQSRSLAQVDLDGRLVHIGAWLVRLGRVNLYLLDTNIEENAPQDRQLSNRLYTADQEQRIQQEVVLGIGGVRILRKLGINPSMWHANEGHTAFMMPERVREEVGKGTPFDEAFQKVQASTVFTTHTPVPAGHDVFDVQLVDKYFHDYWGSLGISREAFFELGQVDSSRVQGFNMTALALRMSARSNAVSRLHGRVSRRMWHFLSPDLAEDDVPILNITNGIHVPTWVAPELGSLYQKYLDEDWVDKHDDAGLWERVLNIPDDELWTVRQILKRKLAGAMRERTRMRLSENDVTPQQLYIMGALLDPEVLTIGFMRRFTEYKRPALILYDIQRLKRIVGDQWRPVQIVFAGKSHPADFPSKNLLQQVHAIASDREFQGRIAFVEDYDMHMARYLVHGVDVWLNNPRRLQEACGTSGMKASLNGVLHLSVRDGWWHEGYNGANGWVIGNGSEASDAREEDRADAEALYKLLESEIVPLYYERDRSGVPHGWIRVIKEAIRSIVPVFCARRMLKEYTEQMYLPAARPPARKDQG